MKMVSVCCGAEINFTRDGEIDHYEDDGPVFCDVWRCSECFNDWTSEERKKKEKPLEITA